MDEILQQMLAIEKEAEAMVRAGEAGAEQAVRDAHREAAALEERRRKEIIEEAGMLYATRVDAAEKERAQRLEAARQELEKRREILLRRVPDAVRRVSRILAGIDPVPDPELTAPREAVTADAETGEGS